MRTMTMNLKAVFLTLTAGFLLAACGQGEGPDGPSAGLCEGICAKFELCDSSTDESDCVEACQQDQSLSASYWTGLANCVDGTSCDRLTQDQLNDCVTDEISRFHSTSTTAQGACETMARTLEVCNEDLDEAGVLKSCVQNTAAYFSDKLMVALEACFFGSCDEIPGCVLRALDDYDADDLYDFFFDSLGISTGSSGGGGSGGGGSLTKEETCEAGLDLLDSSIAEMCRGDYSYCCFCLCWNASQWEEQNTGDYCSCIEPGPDGVGIEYTNGCTDEAAEHSADLIEDPDFVDLEADSFLRFMCD